MEVVDCNGKTDEEVVKLVLSDKAYFSCVIIRYEDKLSRYVRRLARLSDEDVQDILQDIFIKVYVNLNSFDTDLSFSSWIYRIAHNVVISSYRKKDVRPEGHMIDVDDDVLQDIAETMYVEKEIDAQYLRKHLMEALEIIPEKYREILILRYFEEKEYQEISDILEKPMGSVATLINRAKVQLKEAFISLGYSRNDYGG